MDFLGFQLSNNLFVAPMAGVTDRPFRQLCKQLGAGFAVSEMVTSNSLLYGSAKTLRRANHTGEVNPISVQIAGADPKMMAEAAQYNVDHGAQIIDINMGCPAKKVCNVMAGSALMQHEALVAKILEAVVAAVPNTPVTLKFRTGWNRENKNAPTIARIAEASGIRAVAIHGRTRADQYMGEAEYDTIAQVKSLVCIPVIANGDITTPQKAQQVMAYTGADAVMIGRAAQGRPWIFGEVAHYLATGQVLAPPSTRQVQALLLEHLQEHYDLYGEYIGVRSARKHIAWYVASLPGASSFRQTMNALECPQEQYRAVDAFFTQLAEHMPLMPAIAEPTSALEEETEAAL